MFNQILLQLRKMFKPVVPTRFKPKYIYLIRHAESVGNVDPKSYANIPDHALPITATGHAQAIQAGSDLKLAIGSNPVAIYYSPFLRTKLTTHEILKSFSPTQVDRLREDPRLREQEHGHLRAPEVHEVLDTERKAYGTFYYRFPDGESGADVYDRCSMFLDTLYRDFERENYPDHVLIVTHGLTLRLLTMRWLHWTVDTFEQLKNPSNCQYFVLELQKDNHYKLLTPFNTYPITKEIFQPHFVVV